MPSDLSQAGMGPAIRSGKKMAELGSTTRTDLHCEPIANLAIQLEGSKRWTLIEAEHSKLLRPSLAPDRPYVYSRLDPLERRSLARVPRFEVETQPGDVLWVRYAPAAIPAALATASGGKNTLTLCRVGQAPNQCAL